MQKGHEVIGQMYSASFENVAVTAQQDLFTLYPGSTLIFVLHSISLSQSSDAGDTEMEMLNLLYHRQTFGLSGSGGTTILLTNGSPLQAGGTITDTVAGTIINNTTKGTGGTPVRRESFNVSLGYEWRPSEPERIWINPPNVLIVSLETTPNDSLTMSGTVIFEVIGDPS